MKELIRKSKGITLVVLVITIIILLILAGISIAGLTGNGLFEKARLAKERQNEAEQDEDDKMKNYESEIVQYISSSRTVEDMTTEELKTFIETIVENKIKTTVAVETDTPAGSILAQMGNEAPVGYLKCDGTVYNISEYKKLADYINEQFGKYDYWGGDGETTFAVPNLQGEFLRGTGTNSHAQNGNGAAVGVHQDATKRPHMWTWNSGMQFSRVNMSYDNADYYYTGMRGCSNVSVSWSGTENNGIWLTTRPTNTSVLYCIKY